MNQKIDLSVLKKGFEEYLENKAVSEGKAGEVSYEHGASIFMHSEEFKEYLTEEVGLDKSVLSQNINEVMKGISDGSVFTDEQGKVNEEALGNIEDIKDEQKADEQDDVNGVEGEVGNIEDIESEEVDETDVEGDEGEGENEVTSSDDSFVLQALNEALNDDEVINSFDEDGSGDLSKEEIEKFLAAANIDKDLSELSFDEISSLVQGLYETKEKNNLLDKVFKDKDVIGAIDLNGDGKLTDDEKEAFKDFIKGYSGNGEDLTKEDIEKAFNDIVDGKFDYGKVKGDVTGPSNSTGSSADKETTTSPVSQGSSSNGASSGGGVSGSSGGGGGSYGGGGISGSSINSLTSPNAMKNVDNMSLDELEKEKQTKQTDVDNAQKEVDSINSGEKFKSEQENVDKLKEAYEEALKEDENTPPELLECMENIDSKEQEISDTKSKISELGSKEFQQQNVVSGLETTLSQLQSAQSELGSASSDDPDKQGEIQQKQQDLQAKISEIKAQIEKEKASLKEIQDNKQTKEEELTTQESELQQLNELKTKLEEEHKEKMSEKVQKAMDEYNNAKSELDEKKKTAETEAKEKLKTAQDDLKKVNDKINEKKAEEVAGNYQASNSSLPKDVVATLDKKLGNGFCNKLEKICENLQCQPEDLLGLMYSESGLNTTSVNSSSGATGLIQFLPSTAQNLGTSVSALKSMSGVQQLDYVEKYLQNCKSSYFGSGKMTGGDLYALVWLPARAKNEVLVDSPSAKYYSKGLDVNHDGQCTKSDLAQRIKNKYNEWQRSCGLA